MFQDQVIANTSASYSTFVGLSLQSCCQENYMIVLLTNVTARIVASLAECNAHVVIGALPLLTIALLQVLNYVSTWRWFSIWSAANVATAQSAWYAYAAAVCHYGLAVWRGWWSEWSSSVGLSIVQSIQYSTAVVEATRHKNTFWGGGYCCVARASHRQVMKSAYRE